MRANRPTRWRCARQRPDLRLRRDNVRWARRIWVSRRASARYGFTVLPAESVRKSVSPRSTATIGSGAGACSRRDSSTENDTKYRPALSRRTVTILGFGQAGQSGAFVQSGQYGRCDQRSFTCPRPWITSRWSLASKFLRDLHR